MSDHDRGMATPPGPGDLYPWGLHITRSAVARFTIPAAPPEPQRDLVWNLQRMLRRIAALDTGPLPDPAELYLLATLGDIQRHVALNHLETLAAHPASELFQLLPLFWTEYPPACDDRDALRGNPALAELFVHAVQEDNPALRGPLNLLRASDFASRHPLRRRLEQFEDQRRSTDTQEPSLLELLARPHRAAPESLAAQLEFIRLHWAERLPAHLLLRLLHSLDTWHEEHRPRGGGPGPSASPGLGGEHEPEAFSSDAGWMERLVLMAKSTLVWLDQLSQRYATPIRHLDEIPERELEQLAEWGFSGLWLIGLWERSVSSREIKRLRGNPEAEASAYALYDYRVAGELGGEEALERLAARCRRHGIRLACDVVANHSGLHSRWTREHPEWFIQTPHPPYPGYRFSGPDLSPTDDIALYLEDGYWDHSDAAVVFKHVDRRSGTCRYIYHGNDGTHLPWNDTAQLDFLNPQVREMMIETIVGIARRFPIIRFDAAMTLAKRHFQRLWHPLPGSGGGVPSRAGEALPTEAFERAFPVEFWREVVDRVAIEAPDSLLLAEAFWLMEGYFVRSLGMHRVYNSAFMNMLRDEENGKFLETLRNTLAFNHEILRRFVNFMSNPDEATAIEQFGHDDKYFGVAVLLATLPGLPMFGHGQCEGLREKYGMEYRRAYWNEQLDAGLLEHHRNQIFPLLKKRQLFSGSQHFTLFPLNPAHGDDEHVIAFSNRSGGERALVLYHNRYAHVEGTLHIGMGGRDGGGSLERSLGEALGVADSPGTLYRMSSCRDGREYLVRGSELHRRGLHVELGPYGYEVFLDLREQPDPDGQWSLLCDRLQGRAVPSLQRELFRLQLVALHRRLAALFGAPLEELPAAARGAFLHAATLLGSPRPLGAEGRLREHLQGLTRLLRLRPRGVHAAQLVARLVTTGSGPHSPLQAWLLLDALTALAPDRNLLQSLELAALFEPGPAPPLPLLLCLLGRPDAPLARELPLERLLTEPLAVAFLAGKPEEDAGVDAARLAELVDTLTLVRAVSAARFYGPAARPLLRQLTHLETRRRQLLQRAERAGYALERLRRLDTGRIPNARRSRRKP